MKVTSVEPQKKNPHRFNIFLDGQFGFGADEDLVVEHRLVVGKVVEPGDLEKILFEAEVGKLMERMYRLFNVRQRSEKEIRTYLKNLSFKKRVKGDEELSPIVIESTIDKAIQKGLINDEEFARLWLESRSKKYGVNRIKQELYRKGIDREIIEEVVNVQVTGYSQESVIVQTLQKKVKAWKSLPKMDFKKKAIEYLMRRGFEYSAIKPIIENILKKEYNTFSSSEDSEGFDNEGF